MLRIKVKDYKGFKKNNDSKSVLSESKSIKKIVPRYNVVKSKCFTILDEDTEQLFEIFWNNLTWSERKMYMAALCQMYPMKVNTTGTNISRRIGYI